MIQYWLRDHGILFACYMFPPQQQTFLAAASSLNPAKTTSALPSFQLIFQAYVILGIHFSILRITSNIRPIPVPSLGDSLASGVACNNFVTMAGALVTQHI